MRQTPPRRASSGGFTLLVLALLALLLAAAPASAQEPATSPGPSPTAVASRPPEVEAGRLTCLAPGEPAQPPTPEVTPGGDHRCALPDAADFVPAFGTLDPRRAFRWADASGDAPRPATDVTEVRFGRVVLGEADAAAARRADGVVTRGVARRAIRPGPYLVLSIATAESFAAQPDADISLLVVTDADGKPANDIPAMVAAPTSPWIGAQDVYSLAFAREGREPQALSTDFAKKAWYTSGRGWFATARPDGSWEMYLPMRAVGDSFGVLGFSRGDDAGFDSVELGPVGRWLPIDGLAWGLPFLHCLDDTLAHEPLEVDRVAADGQGFGAVEMPAQRRLQAGFRMSAPELDLLMGELDREAGGTVGQARVGMREEGTKVSQLVPLRAVPDATGEGVLVEMALGLARRGRHDVTAIELLPDPDPSRDALLGDLVAALLGTDVPFAVEAEGGLLRGEGTCRADGGA